MKAAAAHAGGVLPLLQRAGGVPAIRRCAQRTLQFALSAEVRSQDAPLLLAQLLARTSSQDDDVGVRQGGMAGA